MNEDLSLLDKLVDNDGMRFTVTTTLSPDIYFKLFLTIAGAVILSVAGAKVLDNVIR